MSMPKLRFKEFNDSWEENRIGEITLKVGSGSTPLGGEKVYQSSGIPFIRSQNVNNERLSFNDIAYISDEINSQMKGSVVKPNDILLNITGASIGRSCVVHTDFETGNVNQHVCIIRLKNDYSSRFLQPYLSSSRGQKSILSTQVGSGREGLNFEAIRSFKVFIPKIEEQTKIANFLTAVDEKITQLTQKCDLLAQYKKGVMQQIFSQELRFQDEDGRDFPEWEEKLFFDFAPLQRGFDLPVNKIVEGEYPVVFSNGILKTHIEFKAYAPGVVTGRSGTIGNVTYVEENYWPHNTALWVTHFNGNNPKFVFYFLIYFDLSKFSTGSGVPTLNRNDVHRQIISIPSVKEQTKIANFLTAIDDKISNAQAQLAAVKQYKQGLLQQMFV